MESNYIDLYLSFEEYNATIYGPYRLFRFLKPKFSNCEGDELLRLSITNEDGTPIATFTVTWAKDVTAPDGIYQASVILRVSPQ